MIPRLQGDASAVFVATMVVFMPCITDDAGAAESRLRSNSLIRLPHGSWFVDVDGDSIAELAQTNSNQLYVNHLDYAGTGKAHFYFDQKIRELAVGRFSAGKATDIAALLEDGTFECIRWDAELSAFTTWLSLQSLVRAGERMVVGDFDGDGRDDLLLHDPATGTVRFLTVRGTGGDASFVPLSVALGDLPPLLPGLEIYAGEFGPKAGRDDLLVLERASGTLRRYDAVDVVDAAGKAVAPPTTKFTLNFTTRAGALGPNELLAIGNVDGDVAESLLSFDAASGRSRFLKARVHDEVLEPIDMPNVQLGAATAAGSRPYLAKMAAWHGERGGDVRDDVLFYDAGTDAGTEEYACSDARFCDGNAYWWSWTRSVRRFDQEFAPLGPKDSWRVLICSDADAPAPAWFTVATFEWLYGKAGRNVPNMYNFFKDMSYGQDAYVADVAPVAPLASKQATRTRTQTWSECVQATATDPNAWSHVLAITDGEDDFGSQGAVTTLASWQSTWTGTPVHEMGHALGLPHCFDDSQNNCSGAPGEYCDPTDPMGSGYARVWNVDFKQGGTGLSVADGYGCVSRMLCGWIPAARRVDLVSGAEKSVRSTRTVELAGLDRPESTGFLVATIQPTADPNDTYTVEFRSKSGRWDVAFPSDGVVVRHFAFNAAWNRPVGYLQTRPHALLQPGETFTAPCGVAVKVVSFDVAGGTASVELTY